MAGVRRRLERVERNGADADRPSLEAVLDHYGVDYPNWKATAMIPCLLHPDDNPSCSINTTKQLWRCHSCGEGGDVWTLIELREGVDFGGAVSLAAAQQLTAGVAGGSGGGIREGRYARSRKVAGGQGNRPRNNGGYVPSWRRK